MIEIKTDFLAEDWLETLEKEVKPAFPGIDFVTYVPESEKVGEIKSPKIAITISEKAAFVYNLKGAQTTPKAVVNSLRRYVFINTKKLMTEK